LVLITYFYTSTNIVLMCR